MEPYAGIRRAVMVDGLSRREGASLDAGLHQPDGFGEKGARRGKKARRMINPARDTLDGASSACQPEPRSAPAEGP